MIILIIFKISKILFKKKCYQQILIKYQKFLYKKIKFDLKTNNK